MFDKIGTISNLLNKIKCDKLSLNITPISDINTTLIPGETNTENSDLLMLEEFSGNISIIEPKRQLESHIDTQVDILSNEDQFSLFIKKCTEKYSHLKSEYEMLNIRNKENNMKTKEVYNTLKELRNLLENIKTTFKIVLKNSMEDWLSESNLKKIIKIFIKTERNKCIKEYDVKEIINIEHMNDKENVIIEVNN